MPKNKKLRVEIIWLHYNVLVAGHGRKQKITELVMRNYWWPEVMKDVRKYVEGCDIYQRIKNRMEVPVELKLSEILKKLQTHLIVDFITKLLVVARKDAILVTCDKLSKMTYFVATTEQTLAEELVRLFRDNVWKLHKLPESIILDRRLQFAAEIMKELNKILGIETKLSTSYYPQMNRQMKRIN